MDNIFTFSPCKEVHFDSFKKKLRNESLDIYSCQKLIHICTIDFMKLFFAAFFFVNLSIAHPTYGLLDKTKPLPIKEIWFDSAIKDPNDHHLKMEHLSQEVRIKLIEQVKKSGMKQEDIDNALNSRIIYKVDINNDEKLEYVFITHSVSAEKSIDKIGPIFQIESFEKIDMPLFPESYTNILLPPFEYGSQGLVINLHSNSKVRDNCDDKTKISGCEKWFSASRRMKFLWKKNQITKIKDQYICDDIKICTENQIKLIRQNL